MDGRHGRMFVPLKASFDTLVAVTTIVVLTLQGLLSLGAFPMAAPDDRPGAAAPATGEAGAWPRTGTEAVIAGYMGVPQTLPSDVAMQRPDGTDIRIKDVRWSAEPFRFPIYAGIRFSRWYGPAGGMIDFLHNKAIAQVGRGAHGRRLTGEAAIPQTVDVAGMLKGKTAEPTYAITDILSRLEFSHGHNMLLPTVLLRLANLNPWLRPYAGIGAGIAIPHVEIFPAGEGEDVRTNEYQIAGPAAQALVGLEIPLRSGPVFIEYKYTWASLATAMTGGKTPNWCNCDFVSDFVRNGLRWIRGEGPQHGTLQTTLATHQIVAGAGYRLGRGR